MTGKMMYVIDSDDAPTPPSKWIDRRIEILKKGKERDENQIERYQSACSNLGTSISEEISDLERYFKSQIVSVPRKDPNLISVSHSAGDETAKTPWHRPTPLMTVMIATNQYGIAANIPCQGKTLSHLPSEGIW